MRFSFITTSLYHQHTHTHTHTVTKYYTTSQQILISCILSVTVLTLISSIVATLISAGFPREKLEFLRHYAVFNIVSCEHTSQRLAVFSDLPWLQF